MKPVFRIAALLGWSLVALVLALPAAAEESLADRLHRSAGWGIDRGTGKVAIEASLLVFYDPASRTLVINPDHEAAAAEDVGAVVQADGSWLLPDGSELNPLRGEVKVLIGNEAEELQREVAGQPQASLDRVELSMTITEGATKTKLFSRCSGCYSCAVGCDGNWLWKPGASYRICEPAGPFRTCKQTLRATCPMDVYSCQGCTGPILSSHYFSNWVCGDC